MKNSKSTRGRNRKRDVVDGDQRAIRRAMDNASSQLVVVRRRLVINTTLATTAAGFIGSNQITNDTARTTNGWSSFAQRYAQFRVRAIQITLMPIVDVNTALTVGGGAVTPHPTGLAFAKFHENLGYPTYVSLLEGQEMRVFQGRERKIVYRVDWTNVPEAKLWSATNAAIPTAQLYGFQYQDGGAAPASAVSTAYYRVVTEFEVDFQVSM